jgi:Transposase
LYELEDAEPPAGWRLDRLPDDDEELAAARAHLLAMAPLPLPGGGGSAYEHLNAWVAALETAGVMVLAVAPHLVHSLRCKAIASARLKNDKVDAAILAQLLRADLLPEAWIAPPAVRQLRALLRHRVALVRLRTLIPIHRPVARPAPAGEHSTSAGGTDGNFSTYSAQRPAAAPRSRS